jgi:predicted PurR-regulated permease PerM
MARTTDDDASDVDHRASPASITDPALRFEAKRALIWALIIGGVALCVIQAHSLLVIFAGIVFAAMIDGGARLLERVLPIARGWRIGIVLLAGVAFLVWLVVYAGSTIAREAAELPAIVEAQLRNAARWAASRGFEIEAADVSGVAGQLVSGVGTVTRALSGIAGSITSVVLMVILGIYFVLEPRLYERGVAWVLPANQRADFHITAQRMASTLRHLLGGRLLGMVVEGVFTWIMLAVYGVPMAALLGLLTGLLAFIPNIGAVISGVLMVLVGFSGGTEMGLYTVFVYFAVQTIDGYVLIPLIAKKTVDLAPALVLSGQLVMGVMFGIIGLALADPLLAMIKVALERRSEQAEEEQRLAASSNGP